RRPACGVRALRSLTLPDPESEQGEDTHAEGQAHETFGDRPQSTQAESTDVLRVLDLGGDELDEVAHLVVTEVAGETRHVARTGADRLGDLGRGDVSKRRRVRAHRQRVAVALDGVTGRAVE